MGKIKVTQVRSAIKHTDRQKKTLVALGIKKMHQTVELEATPQVMGMVKKLSHLLQVEETK
ncbi:MAG TPA: 50S ribosomal protein L30 [Bacteroides sp.]|nr:50S ribosomal protein L30 [Bacteroides sp.]